MRAGGRQSVCHDAHLDSCLSGRPGRHFAPAFCLLASPGRPCSFGRRPHFWLLASSFWILTSSSSSCS